MFLNNNYGTRAVIICFCFVPIDMINDHKNHKKIFYSRNTLLW